MLFDHARESPQGLALDDLTRRRTWAELADRATRIARLLRGDLGLRPDDHAAFLLDNRVECIELTLGAMLAGIWLTPINRHLAAEEIAYVVADSGAQVLLTDAVHEALARASAAAAAGPAAPGEAAVRASASPRGLATPGTGRAETPGRRPPRVVTVGEELDRLLARACDEPMPLDGPPGATMIYTSGTTGRPKGVKRNRAATLGQALAAAAAGGRAIGLDGAGPHLVTGPLYHAAPLLFAIYDMLGGAPIVILPRWDAVQALHLIEERRIAHTHVVPTMLVRLLHLDDSVRAAFDPSPLRLVLHGAAPIAPAVKRRMIEWWGEVLVEYWGATEGGVCTLVGSADWLEHPGTVGRPLSGWQVFAVDAEGHRLPAGEEGMLYCRKPGVSNVFEYHGAPQKTAEAHLEPGVFTTGDIGRVDRDGWVYLTDRASSMIISGGVNVYPVEVEHVLQQHPAVADVAVFGIPHEEWGEEVKAAVELRDGQRPSEELAAEIMAFARRHLAGYKVPRSIDFEERLPRHPTGKLYTRLLRERYWKGQGRRI